VKLALRCAQNFGVALSANFQGFLDGVGVSARNGLLPFGVVNPNKCTLTQSGKIWEVWAAARSIRSYHAVPPAAPILTETVLRRGSALRFAQGRKPSRFSAECPPLLQPKNWSGKRRYVTIWGRAGDSKCVRIPELFDALFPRYLAVIKS
jgi:hypothetical protein